MGQPLEGFWTNMYILAHMPLALRDDDQNDEIRAAYVLNEQSQNNENLAAYAI